MRPTWNGHVSFGLISIPVSLYTAVEASEHVSFRLLHRKDKAPIHYKKFCSKEDVEKGEFSLIEKEEIKKLEQEAGGSRGEMEVLQFVEFGSLNPLSFQTPYYMAPRKGGDKAYSVLREALNETHRVAIARFALRERPTLAVLIPGPRVVSVETLRPFEELRDPKDLPIPASTGKSAEVKMAKLLIDQMAAEEFDPTAHPNEYKKGLQKLLASRRRFSVKDQAPATDNVVDLMDALKRSLGKAKAAPRRAASHRRGVA